MVSSVDPSPVPQTSRSPPVDMSLRCRAASVPSGAKCSSELYKGRASLIALVSAD